MNTLTLTHSRYTLQPAEDIFAKAIKREHGGLFIIEISVDLQYDRKLEVFHSE